MAAAYIDIALKPYVAGLLHLTTLTKAPGAVWDNNFNEGFNGSDWILHPTFASMSSTPGEEWQTYRKQFGGKQIVWTNYDALSGGDWGLYMQNTGFPDNAYAIGAEGGPLLSDINLENTNSILSATGHMRVGGATQMPFGMKFTIPADQRGRNFTWYGRCYDGVGGTVGYQVQAEFEDGSLSETFTLNNSSTSSRFTCAFRSLDPTNLILKVACTSGVSGATVGIIDFQTATLDMFVQPARPTMAKHYFNYLNLHGGKNL